MKSTSEAYSENIKMATQTAEKTRTSEGTMFWHEDLPEAYKLASKYAGKKGRVATMPDVISAKITADEWGPLWTNYITTSSGEFYGKSKGGILIVVVGHGIDEILQDERIMKRSTKNLRENSQIQLTPREFQRLEDGAYGSVEVIPHSTIVNMREYPTSVLSYEQTLSKDPLLLARLGPKAVDFLAKHRDITMKESGNDFIIANDHNYPYRSRENAGGLITITQLQNMQRCGGEPSSVSTEVDLSDLTHAARFIAMNGKGYLGAVNEGLAPILRDLASNWQRLSVPYSGAVPDFFTLTRSGDEWFTMYPKNGDGMDMGVPQFHVKNLREIEGPESFRTVIGGYHGLLKYDVNEVKSIAPKDANAYVKGEGQIIWEGGNPKEHEVPVTFFNAEVDTSRRVLKEEEVKRDLGLVRRLLSA